MVGLIFSIVALKVLFFIFASDKARHFVGSHLVLNSLFVVVVVIASFWCLYTSLPTADEVTNLVFEFAWGYME